jgi:hypothetical protein
MSRRLLIRSGAEPVVFQKPESRDAEDGPAEKVVSEKKPSIFSRTMRGASWLAGAPGDWFGRKRVGSGASLIGGLWKRNREGNSRDTRFKTDDSGGFDLTATAFSYGVSVPVLEQRLQQRRRLTALTSYGALGIAGLSVLFWVHAAINQPYTVARAVMIWEFLPFISLFVLLAFYYALLNFQIRKRRSAGWREFLSTDVGFFPR